MRSSFYVYPYESKKGTYFYYKAWDGDKLRGDWPTYAKTERAAIIHCAKLEAQGKLIPKPRQKKHVRINQTFQEYAVDFWDYDKSKYIQGLLKRGKTYSRTNAEIQDGNCRKHIIPVFGETSLTDISAGEIEDWLISLTEEKDGKPGLSPKTANNNLNTLKVMFKTARKWGIITGNPALEIEPLEKQTKKRGILTIGEVKTLLNPDTISEVWNNQIIVYAANFIAACTGMRQGEILALRSEKLNPGYIEVSESFERNYGLKGTKTGKTRYVVLISKAQELLNELSEMNDGFLFSMDGGETPIFHRNLTLGLYSAMKAIGIKPDDRKRRNINFHSWRHFFNTTLRAAGVSDSKLQALTGHSSAQMSDNYTHFQIEHFSNEREAIQGVFDGVK